MQVESGLSRWAGIAAPLVYAAAVVFGGLATPGYSHLESPISALMAGGEGGFALNALFAAYNVLLGLFALGFMRRVTSANAGFVVSAWLLALCAALGIALLAAPMDPIGLPATPTGITHLVLAGMASVASMAAIAAGAVGWRRAGRRSAALLSWAALAVVFLSGAIAAAAAAGGWPTAGLFERLTIGAFLAWVLWTSAILPARRAATAAGG